MIATRLHAGALALIGALALVGALIMGAPTAVALAGAPATADARLGATTAKVKGGLIVLLTRRTVFRRFSARSTSRATRRIRSRRPAADG